MKFEILHLLSRGPKSEIELAAFFGAVQLPEVMRIILELQSQGIIEASSRQIKQANNVVRWDYEFRLRVQSVSAA